MCSYIYGGCCKIREELEQYSWKLVAVTSLHLYRYSRIRSGKKLYNIRGNWWLWRHCLYIDISLYSYSIREELVQYSWKLVAATSLPLYRYIVISVFDQGRTCTVFVETGRCYVTGVLLSNQGYCVMDLDIFAHVVGPCHHCMARPQVADRGTASDKESSCEYIE